MAFENAYESSIIFQPLLYANVPAESPSYASTFFVDVILKWVWKSFPSVVWDKITIMYMNVPFIVIFNNSLYNPQQCYR